MLSRPSAVSMMVILSLVSEVLISEPVMVAEAPLINVGSGTETKMKPKIFRK